MAGIAVTGIRKVLTNLKKLAKEYGKPKTEVVAGYGADYALAVHEDVEAFHTVGQAKFLERPARVHAKDLAKMVTDKVKKKVPVNQALLTAGLYLQRLSQEMCPVDTGNLKASAFTRLETGK